MNCERAREHFSEWVDGALPEAREREVRGHVEACDACAVEWRGFERAVGLLRATGARRTPAHVKEVVLAAVDAAAREDARADEDEFRRATLLAVGRFERGLRRRRIATHAAALLVGAALVLVWLALRGSSAVERGSTVDPLLGERQESERPPRVVEVPVFVERSIEVQRFVPVVREVAVERIVEHERNVYRGPLLTLDFTALAAAVEGLGAALERVARAPGPVVEHGEGQARQAERTESTDGERAPALLARSDEPFERDLDPGRAAAQGLASVRLSRTGEHLKLETFGSVSEVVPVLLSQLESEDAEVAALVERRLDAIRGAADGDQVPMMRATTGAGLRERDVLARIFGGSEPVPESRSERWGTWWAENGVLIAEAERRGSQ